MLSKFMDWGGQILKIMDLIGINPNLVFVKFTLKINCKVICKHKIKNIYVLLYDWML